MTACACIGPVGDCPCIRRSRGLPVPITETYIAPEMFELLPDADKETINRLKLKALGLRLRGKSGGAAGLPDGEEPEKAAGAPVDPEIQRLAGVAVRESAGSVPVQDWQEAALRVCRAVLAQTVPASEPSREEIDEAFYRAVSPGLPQAEIDAALEWFRLGAMEFFGHGAGAVDRFQVLTLITQLEIAVHAADGDLRNREVVQARKAVCAAIFDKAVAE